MNTIGASCTFQILCWVPCALLLATPGAAGAAPPSTVEACALGDLAACDRLLLTAAPRSERAAACDHGDRLACFLVGYGGRYGKSEEKPLQHACDLGHAAACELAGLFSGGGGDGRAERATALLGRACDAGDLHACLALAEGYGDGLEPGNDLVIDRAHTEELYRRTCDGGLCDGCAGLAWHRRRFAAEARERTQRLNEVRGSCDRGCAHACYLLARRDMGWDRDGQSASSDSRACRHAERACRLGETAGCVLMNTCPNQAASNAETIRSSFSECIEAEVGHACFEAGELLEGARGVVTDMEVAALLHQRACNGDLLDACAHLADLRLKAALQDRGKQAALAVYQTGCQHGAVSVCVDLGRQFADGSAYTKRDLRLAAETLSRACDLGGMTGCTRLGEIELQRSSQKTPETISKALALLERGCLLGDANGCAGAATLLSKSVPRDQSKVLALLRQACSLGHRQSCELHGAPTAARLVNVRHAAFDAPAILPRDLYFLDEHRLLVPRGERVEIRDSKSGAELSPARKAAASVRAVDASHTRAVLDARGGLVVSPLESTAVPIGLVAPGAVAELLIAVRLDGKALAAIVKGRGYPSIGRTVALQRWDFEGHLIGKAFELGVDCLHASRYLDDKRFAAVCPDGVTVFDPSGSAPTRWSAQWPPWQTHLWATARLDGAALLVIEDDSRLWIYDLASVGAAPRRLATSAFSLPDDRLEHAVWSPSGRYLAVVGYQAVQLFDGRDGTPESPPLIIRTPRIMEIHAMAFSPDERTLVLADEREKELIIVDIEP